MANNSKGWAINDTVMLHIDIDNMVAKKGSIRNEVLSATTRVFIAHCSHAFKTVSHPSGSTCI